MKKKKATKRPRKITPTRFVREWIKDLRSGKYKQGKGALKTVNFDGSIGYCCLGVACLTAHRLNIRASKRENPADNLAGDGYPGSWLKKLLGSVNPELTFTPEFHTTCSLANDHFDKSFEDIADALERTYLSKGKK